MTYYSIWQSINEICPRTTLHNTALKINSFLLTSNLSSQEDFLGAWTVHQEKQQFSPGKAIHLVQEMVSQWNIPHQTFFTLKHTYIPNKQSKHLSKFADMKYYLARTFPHTLCSYKHSYSHNHIHIAYKTIHT